ncbi:histidinol-phosphatase [Pigmentiphaga aceris]|uniref:Histidinol-phosphatase n=1 Tax=Pigmentiphaga aceris TaxID=1940612 RepID=A0A5C0AY87_9BURK|nr:histidinol-phosphatase [Pigmentiphaga aceris]QEI07419.1 histidinol-phosphatase [Pigmentiphaga aceris]
MPYTEALPADVAASLSAYATLAHELADEARALALRYFRTRLDIIDKADESPVTIADREVEAAMRKRIGERYPSHGILGEEHGQAATDAEFVWVLDPIDGTRSFISGSPLWGVLIALLWRGRPILGLIEVPMTGERWFGLEGHGAALNGTEARASNCTTLADACLYSTSPDIFDADGWERFERVRKQTRMRRFGGDCYSYGLLASGHIDLVIESGLQPYDYLAIVTVLAQAGAVITDWEGQPLTMASNGNVVAAATATLHAEALRVLRG